MQQKEAIYFLASKKFTWLVDSFIYRSPWQVSQKVSFTALSPKQDQLLRVENVHFNLTSWLITWSCEQIVSVHAFHSPSHIKEIITAEYGLI